MHTGMHDPHWSGSHLISFEHLLWLFQGVLPGWFRGECRMPLKNIYKNKDDSLPALGPPQCNYHRVIKPGLLEKPPLGSMLRISAPITTEFPWFSHRHVLIAGDLRPAISARLDNYEAHADERNKDAFKVSLAASSGKSPCLRWIIIHTWARAASPADRDRFLWGKCWGKWGQHLCKTWSWLKLTSLTYWNYCCHSPFPFPYVFSKKRGDFAHCRSFIVWEYGSRMIEPSKCQTFGATENSVDARKTHCDTMTFSDRKARAHFPHMFPTASRESRQLPTRVGCKLFDFGLRLILFHQISLSCAKDWSFRPSPSFPRDLPDLPDPAARWWIATRMASWWWKRSNRVSFRAPTATASSTRPSRCPPPKPSRTARICQDSRGRMLLACSNMLVTWVDWIWLRSVAKDQQNSPKVWWNFGFRFWPIDSKPFWETPCNQSPASKRTWSSHGCPWRGWHMLSQLVATLAPPWIPTDPDFQAWTAKCFQFAVLHVKMVWDGMGMFAIFIPMTFILVSSSQP